MSVRGTSPLSGNCLSVNIAHIINGIRFVNLQYGDCAEEIAVVNKQFSVSLYDDETVDPLKDMDRFAAQVAAMDLVVTVSNSTAPLAGGLGIPVWGLLSKVSDWRYLLERKDTPWYESMRFFRQRTRGDWCEVMG